MALLWMDGFDDIASNGTTNWAARGYNVLYNGVIQSPGRGGVGQSVHPQESGLGIPIAASSEVYMGFALKPYFNFTGRYVQFRDNSNIHGYFGFEAGGALRVEGPGFTDVSCSSSLGVLPAGSDWHYVEVYFKVGQTTGAASIRVDGTEVASTTGVDLYSAGATTINNIAIGAYGYFDDLIVMNSTGSALNTFQGDCSVKTIFPNGNGNYSQLVGSDADSTDNYLLVDESPGWATADYVESSTVGNKDTYAFSDVSTSGTVLAVQVGSVAQKSDTGAISGRPVIRRASVDAFGSDVVLDVSAKYFKQIYETDPTDASAWTPAKVNAAEFGWEVRS